MLFFLSKEIDRNNCRSKGNNVIRPFLVSFIQHMVHVEIMQYRCKFSQPAWSLKVFMFYTKFFILPNWIDRQIDVHNILKLLHYSNICIKLCVVYTIAPVRCNCCLFLQNRQINQMQNWFHLIPVVHTLLHSGSYIIFTKHIVKAYGFCNRMWRWMHQY